MEVSELSVGTWGLSGDAYGPLADAEVDRVIDRALSVGVTLFDTADVYGRGDMERRLAKRLEERSWVHVATKIGTDLESSPPRKHFDPAYLFTAYERSQERLKREVIDVLLLHNPSVQALGRSETVGFMKDLKAKGKILAWGVSAGTADQARAAIRSEADVIELAYNIFATADLNDVAADIEESGVGVLARSVLAHGLLGGQWSRDREFYPDDHRSDRWTPAELRTRVKQVDALRPLLGGAVISTRSLALRFVLANQLVSTAVLGPRSVGQLDQLVRESGLPPYLRDTTMADLSTRMKKVGVEI
ncbi:Aldo-keto reductase [Chondromyces apiculatus DSM 436]|uniref:Aldo-keto reductase n=2 Tax=Chondromyces apiculatus TaxID=51 RepID=A0A017SXE1_9BACT|nr:Aldo-keto reductase [Chondromyces apiculatus DSM 436]